MTIKLGKYYLVLPDAFSELLHQKKNAKAEKDKRVNSEKNPDNIHAYNTSDPYRVNIDATVAEGGISRVEKKWVKISYVIIFIILPISTAILATCVYPESYLSIWLFASIVVAPYVRMLLKKPNN